MGECKTMSENVVTEIEPLASTQASPHSQFVMLTLVRYRRSLIR
jgi:hypothetical protein